MKFSVSCKSLLFYSITPGGKVQVLIPGVIAAAADMADRWTSSVRQQLAQLNVPSTHSSGWVAVLTNV